MFSIKPTLSALHRQSEVPENKNTEEWTCFIHLGFIGQKTNVVKKKNNNFCCLFEATQPILSMMSGTKDEKQDEEKIYGGCEGPDAMYVKLISSDGHEFIVKRDHALTWGTIKAMLSGPGQFAENETSKFQRDS